MAYITKRGSSYSVRYTYQDEHGKSCDKWESFPTKEEAVKRQKQIEHELATGNFLIPSTVTVAEFLMDWLPKQQKRTLSGTTLHEVHQLLHNSFLLAVEWGILIKSPVPVEAPKKTTQERSIWEVEEMRAALDSMEDPHPASGGAPDSGGCAPRG